MMQKNQLILSVRDLNIQFNLRGKVLHAIRGIDWTCTRARCLPSWARAAPASVFTKSFMGLLDANGSITGGTIDYYGARTASPCAFRPRPKRTGCRSAARRSPWSCRTP